MSKDTVEVEVQEASSESNVQMETSTLTEAAARESGLSAEEINAGKKHGLIKDDGKPAQKAPVKVKKESDDDTDEDDFSDTDDDDADDDADDTTKTDKVKDEEAADPKDAAEDDLDPEEEAELIKGYNTNEKTLYWKAKKERLKRQGAQRETEHTKIKLAAAERELNALKTGKKDVDSDDNDENKEDAEDDDSRVMTVGEYKKLMAKQQEARNQENVKARETITRLESQEAEFKLEHEDFDEVADLAKQMMNDDPSYADIMLRAAADPKKNAAQIVYNIGRLHPKYKQGGMKKPVVDGDPKSKKQVEKAIVNADKRQSSASVTSGGAKRIVSEADLTVEDAANLAPAAYAKLSQATRDRLLRESCA